jgi:hypothetical protein
MVVLMTDPEHPTQGTRRPDPGRPSRLLRGSIGVFCTVLLVGGATLTSPVALAAGSPLTWGAPVLVDHQAPFGNPDPLYGVSCPSSGLCVAVDRAGNVVTSTNPTGGESAWTVTDVDGAPLDGAPLDGVSCPGTGLCVAVDWSGDVVTSTNPTGGASAWTVTAVDSSNLLSGVSCPSTSLCVAVDSAGNVVTSTNPPGGASAWTVTDVDGSNWLDGVSCTSSGLCVAVDGYGNVVTSTNPTGGASAWTVTDVDGSHGLYGVSCPSSGLCVAVGQGGNVVTSTSATAGASAWTVTHADGTNGLDGVSCPSSGLCVAVDGAGYVVTSTNPTGGASAWTVTSVDVSIDHLNSLDGASCSNSGFCVAVDNGGNVVTSTHPTGGASAWTVTNVDGTNSLYGVSCPSSGLCVAADDAGNVVTSTNPTAGVADWTVTHVDGTNELVGVSCPSSGLCVAVDDAGNVVTSTDPTGGASAWTVTDVDGTTSLNGVSCPSSGLCVAVGGGDVVTSTNPTGGAAAWTVAHAGSYLLNGVSCPSSSLCVAVDEAGDVVTSTNPAAATPAWTSADVDGTTGLNGVSCPNSGLCVASDWNGDVVTSTDPTGGTPAWTVTHVDSSDWLNGVSCPSSGLCVAVDGIGDVVTSTNPTGGASAWTVTDVDGSNELEGVSCPSISLCVAVDYAGDVIAGAVSDSLQDVPSTQQYLLHGSDGATWEAMDADLLADTFTPTTTGTAVLSANADLWTFNAGFNQDLGICLVPGSNAPATCPTGDLLAWKESGGFAGTFSPNAAYVQATAPVTSGTTYTAFIAWKANKAMPSGDTIAAGAGSSPTFSPTRLTVALPDGSNVESSTSSTEQYLLHGSDGSTWNYVDPSALKLTLTPGSSVKTVLSANADLWTFNAGFNQDIGICVAAGASLPAGSCPSADVVIWKESGGFAGTFSPNAAFAQTVVPMSAGTYSVALVWKTNQTMPSGDTIAIGAGNSPTFSPTRLTALEYPASGSGAAIASSTEQYILDGGSDGATWQPIDATHLSLTVPQATGCQAEIGGNADLWTFNAGFNQDIGIQVTPAGGSPYVAAWKESGGFAGTFSPNAAFVQAVIPLSDAASYTITLVWKTNIPMSSSDHIAVAAGSTGAFSPTTLTVTEHC